MCQKILHIPSFSWGALYVYNAIKGKHLQSDRFKSRYFLFHVKPRDKDGLIILSKFSAEMFLQTASNGINTFFTKSNIEICIIIWHSHTKIEHPHNHTKERKRYHNWYDWNPFTFLYKIRLSYDTFLSPLHAYKEKVQGAAQN